MGFPPRLPPSPRYLDDLGFGPGGVGADGWSTSTDAYLDRRRAEILASHKAPPAVRPGFYGRYVQPVVHGIAAPLHALDAGYSTVANLARGAVEGDPLTHFRLAPGAAEGGILGDAAGAVGFGSPRLEQTSALELARAGLSQIPSVLTDEYDVTRPVESYIPGRGPGDDPEARARWAALNPKAAFAEAVGNPSADLALGLGVSPVIAGMTKLGQLVQGGVAAGRFATTYIPASQAVPTAAQIAPATQAAVKILRRAGRVQAANRLIGAAFVPGMAEGAVQGLGQTMDLAKEHGWTDPRTVESGVGAAASGVFAAIGGRHALHSSRIPQVPIQQTVHTMSAPRVIPQPAAGLPPGPPVPPVGGVPAVRPTPTWRNPFPRGIPPGAPPEPPVGTSAWWDWWHQNNPSSGPPPGWGGQGGGAPVPPVERPAGFQAGATILRRAGRPEAAERLLRPAPDAPPPVERQPLALPEAPGEALLEAELNPDGPPSYGPSPVEMMTPLYEGLVAPPRPHEPGTPLPGPDVESLTRLVNEPPPTRPQRQPSPDIQLEAPPPMRRAAPREARPVVPDPDVEALTRMVNEPAPRRPAPERDLQAERDEALEIPPGTAEGRAKARVGILAEQLVDAPFREHVLTGGGRTPENVSKIEASIRRMAEALPEEDRADAVADASHRLASRIEGMNYIENKGRQYGPGPDGVRRISAGSGKHKIDVFIQSHGGKVVGAGQGDVAGHRGMIAAGPKVGSPVSARALYEAMDLAGLKPSDVLSPYGAEAQGRQRDRPDGAEPAATRSGGVQPGVDGPLPEAPGGVRGAAGGGDSLEVVPPKAVHDAAAAHDVAVDTETFKQASKAITGKRHLDDMTSEELQKILDAIEENPSRFKRIGAAPVPKPEVGFPTAEGLPGEVRPRPMAGATPAWGGWKPGDILITTTGNRWPFVRQAEDGRMIFKGRDGEDIKMWPAQVADTLKAGSQRQPKEEAAPFTEAPATAAPSGKTPPAGPIAQAIEWALSKDGRAAFPDEPANSPQENLASRLESMWMVAQDQQNGSVAGTSRWKSGDLAQAQRWVEANWDKKPVTPQIVPQPKAPARDWHVAGEHDSRGNRVWAVINPDGIHVGAPQKSRIAAEQAMISAKTAAEAVSGYVLPSFATAGHVPTATAMEALWERADAIATRASELGDKVTANELLLGRIILPGHEGIANEYKEAKKAEKKAAKPSANQEIKKWLGDSTAVDKNGEPLLAYHGTPTGGFAEFDTNRQGTKGGRARGGFSFTTDRGAAQEYADSWDATQNQLDEITLQVNKVFASLQDRWTDALDDEFGTAGDAPEWDPTSFDEGIEDARYAIEDAAERLEGHGFKAEAAQLREAINAAQVGSPTLYEVYLRVPPGSPEFHATKKTLGEIVAGLDVRHVPGKAATVHMPDGTKIFYVADASQIKIVKGAKDVTKPAEKPIVEREEPSEPTDATTALPGTESPRGAGSGSEETLEAVPPGDVPEAPVGGDAAESGSEGGRSDGGGASRPGNGPKQDGVGPGVGAGAGAIRLPSGGSERPNAPVRPPRATRQRGTDYRITEGDDLGSGGPVTKARRNLEIIALAEKITKEGRLATPEEQATLVKYVGWGGIPQVFDPYTRDDTMREIGRELRGLLSNEEYEAARRSTLNAHYTSEMVIDGGIWAGLKRLGVPAGASFLEPAMGIGHFLGRQPEDMLPAPRYGVELDRISGTISKLLYPNASISIKGFQEAKLPTVDVVASNVPFGKITIHDRTYSKFPFMLESVHNYFFAKALDQVHPGGIVAFITSHFTMDAQDPRVRQYIAERADLLGAIRLPNTAFKGNAGTEVTTDIIFLRKHAEGEGKSGEEFETLSKADGLDKNGKKVSGKVLQNDYFTRHPEMVIGTPSMRGSMHARGNDPDSEGEYTVEGTVTKEALAAAVANLPESKYTAVEHQIPESVALEQAPTTLKDRAFTFKDGKPFQKVGEHLVPVAVSDARAKQLKAAVAVRDALQELIREELGIEPDETVEQRRKALGKAYDSFVKSYGPLSNKQNTALMKLDPDAPLLLALEDYDRTTDKATKTPIFSKRTIARYLPPTAAGSPAEALTISLGERGRVDFQRMAELTKLSKDDLAESLAADGLIFKNPDGLQWETKEEYLSGPVRKKLAKAEAAADADPAFDVNVAALKKVQPEDLKPSEITARLGANWIEPRDVEQFVVDLLEIGRWNAERLKVKYDDFGAKWTVSARNVSGNLGLHEAYGTEKADVFDLLSDTLNLKSTTIYDVDRDGNKTVNEKKTAEAREKQDKIREAFSKWIWKDGPRTERLLEVYNHRFNDSVRRESTGNHLALPGMARGVLRGGDLGRHQKDAVWRAITMPPGGGLLLNQAVGAGKSFEMAAIAMEMRRLGLARKPMQVSPNALVGQAAAEALRLYPQAKVLVLDEPDWKKGKREETMSRIATGDYDLVIVPISSFKFLPVKTETLKGFIDEEIAEIVTALDAAQADGDKKTVKQLETMKANAEARIAKLLDTQKDAAVSFEELGVDMLIVDEAHAFKNIAIPTRAQMAGIANSRSQQAQDMLMKTRWLRRRGGRVVFATATPVTNTVGEVFVMQKFLQPEALDERGISHFDAWRSQFGEAITSVELSVDGKTYKQKERFARFVNVGELAQMFAEVTQTDLASDLGLPSPKMKGGAPIVHTSEPSKTQEAYIRLLVARAEDLKKRSGPPEKGEDNILVIATDGRKAATDMRLIDSRFEDAPGSKINEVVNTIASIYKRKLSVEKHTQLVFLDLSTPKEEKEVKEAKEPAATTGEEDEAQDTEADDTAEEKAATTGLYEDIRDKLVAKGVPRSEIRFIHEAKTRKARLELYADMNAGRVRVMLASRAKGGVGMNVQKRLYALHDIDAPWRPDQMIQGAGRIFRQGNEFPEVEWHRYVTKGSFDAFMWQTLERKDGFLQDFYRSTAKTRSIEDTGVVALTADQMKAAASGRQEVLEKVVVDSELRRLRSLENAFDDSRVRQRRDITSAKQFAKYKEDESERLTEQWAEVLRGKNKEKETDTWALTLGKKSYDDRESAGKALHKLVVDNEDGEVGQAIALGQRLGQPVVLRFQMETKTIYDEKTKLYKGRTMKVPNLSVGGVDFNLNPESPTGTMKSMDYALYSIETQLTQAKAAVVFNHKKVEDLERIQKVPFEHAEKIAELTKRAAELTKILSDDGSSAEDKAEVLAAKMKEYDQATTLAGKLAAWGHRTPAKIEAPDVMARLRAANRAAEAGGAPPKEPPKEAPETATEGPDDEEGPGEEGDEGPDPDEPRPIFDGEAAKERLRKRGGSQANDLGTAAAQGAGALYDAAVYGASLIERGIRQFGPWSRAMADGIGAFVRNLGQHLKNLYRRATQMFTNRPRQPQAPAGTASTQQPRPAAGRPAAGPPTPPRPGAATAAGAAAGAPRPTVQGETLADKFARIFQDQTRRVEVYEKAVGGAARGIHEAFSGVRAKAAAAQAALRAEFVDPLIKELGKRKVQDGDFQDYMTLLHKPARDAEIRRRDPSQTEGSGWSAADAAARWAELEARYGRRVNGKIAHLEDAAALARGLRDRALDLSVKGGLRSQAQVNALKQAWGDDYVPQRTFEAEDGMDGALGEGMGGRGFEVRGKESKAAHGRTSKADDPIAFLLQQALRTITRAEKNKADQKFADWVRTNNLFDMDKKHTQPGFRRATPKPQKAAYKTIQDWRAAVQTWRAQPKVSKQVRNALRESQDYHYKVDGVAHRIDIASVDPLLDRALRNMAADQMNGFVGALAQATRRFSRMVTTFTPSFMFSNFARDIQAATVNIAAEHGAGVAKDVFKGLRKSMTGMYQFARDPLRQGALFDTIREFKEDGGSVGWSEVQSARDLSKSLAAQINAQGPGAANAVKRAFHGMGKLVEDVNGAVENATRFSVYQALRKAGVSRAKAGHAARNVTLDFTKRGEAGPVLNSLYAFFNANVQGAKRLKEVAIDNPRGRAIVGGLVGAGMALDAWNRAQAGDANEDGTNDYDEIPDFLKAKNFIIMRGAGEKPIMFPMPYGFNIFHALGRHTMAAMQGAETPAQAALGTLASAYNAFNPLGGEAGFVQTITPTLLDPFVQHATNETWTGRKLQPEQFPGAPRKPASEMFYRNVSPTAKAVARFLNDHSGGDSVTPGLISVSPEVISHYASAANSYITGGLGREGLQVAETASKVARGETPELRQIPVAKRFFYERGPGVSGQRYRENAQELEDVWGRYQGYQKTGEIQKARQIPAAMLRAKRYFDGIDKQIRALKRAPLPEAERDRRIQELQNRANRTFVQAARP